MIRLYFLLEYVLEVERKIRQFVCETAIAQTCRKEDVLIRVLDGYAAYIIFSER